MKIPKSINAFRRSLMRKLTENIGKSGFEKVEKDDLKIKKILIKINNFHLVAAVSLINL